MELAGVPVTREQVVELADILRQTGAHDTAEAVLRALDAGAGAYLTLEDRNAIILALEGRSQALEPLRLAILEDLGQVDEPQ